MSEQMRRPKRVREVELSGREEGDGDNDDDDYGVVRMNPDGGNGLGDNGDDHVSRPPSSA